MKVDGGLKQLDSGPSGIVCGISHNFEFYCREGITESKPTGTKWRKLGGILTYISCGDYGCWGVNKHHNVYLIEDTGIQTGLTTR